MNDFGDVLDKTHVEHAVYLVENENLDFLQIQVALTQVVKQTTGSCDHDIGLVAQLLELFAILYSPVEKGHVHAQMLAVNAKVFFDLDGQFASRGQGQGPAFPGFSNLWRVGKAKAAVLPVPV